MFDLIVRLKLQNVNSIRLRYSLDKSFEIDAKRLGIIQQNWWKVTLTLYLHLYFVAF